MKATIPVLAVAGLLFCTAVASAQDSSRASTRLFRDAYRLKASSLVIPGAFTVYGCLKPVIPGIGTVDEKLMKKIENNAPLFYTRADDYLNWAPSASIYIMDAFKVKMSHHFKEHLIIEGGSLLITGGVGLGMRLVSKQMKAYPAGTKFPSGHTANTFRGAEIVHQELKHTHPVWSYAGYVLATGVGILRIYNKQHYLSEVVTGAGIGMLSVKATYWLLHRLKKKP